MGCEILQPILPDTSIASINRVTQRPGLGDELAGRSRLPCKIRTPTDRTTSAKAPECYLGSRTALLPMYLDRTDLALLEVREAP